MLMASFDDKLRKLMTDDRHEEMPENYSWDDTAEEIYAKMDDAKSKKRRGAIWWFLLSAVVGVVSAFIWFQLSSDSDTAQIQKQAPMATSEKVESPTATQERKIQPTLQIDDDGLLTSKTNEPNADSKANDVVESIATQNIGKPSIALTSQRQQIRVNNNIFEDTKDSPMIAKLSSVITGATSQDQKGTLTHKEATAVGSRMKMEIPALDMGIALLTISDRADKGLPAYLIDLPMLKNSTLQESSPLIFSAGLRAGTDLATGSYGGDGENRNNYSSWQPGYHAGIDITAANRRGWSLALGYDQDFAVQLFNLDIEDSVTHQDQDVVTRITVNALTGSEAHQTGTISQQLVRVRQYKTYNTFRSHSLTALIGKSFDLTNAWSIGLGAGSRCTFSRASSGYTLDKGGEILAYKPDSDIYQAGTVDLLAAVNVGYKLTDHLTASLYARANKSLSNWSGEEAVSYSPTLVQLGAGVAYQF